MELEQGGTNLHGLPPRQHGCLSMDLAAAVGLRLHVSLFSPIERDDVGIVDQTGPRRTPRRVPVVLSAERPQLAVQR